MIQTNVDDSTANLRDLIEAALQGEDVLITLEDGEHLKVVRLIAVPIAAQPPRKPQFGSAKGLFEMSDDFDEPLEDFKDYMD